MQLSADREAERRVGEIYCFVVRSGRHCQSMLVFVNFYMYIFVVGEDLMED